MTEPKTWKIGCAVINVNRLNAVHVISLTLVYKFDRCNPLVLRGDFSKTWIIQQIFVPKGLNYSYNYIRKLCSQPLQVLFSCTLLIFRRFYYPGAWSTLFNTEDEIKHCPQRLGTANAYTAYMQHGV